MSPKQIQNCEIISEIGSGGMAVIYKAVQNSLNRPVAIKELKSDFVQDPQVTARFIREATALASLQHENIVHIYDFVKTEAMFSMVMEYVDGIDLYDLLEKVQVVPQDVALIIALSVCRALEYAHFRGIIHRDIKPSNVIISRKGEVKLMDFGIARDENLGDLTRPGTSLGTPAYMSPEQIMGVKIDARSDLFSLGVVLYQMTTGSKPFVEGAGKSIMHKILNGEFIRPRKLNPNIPRVLEKIILRCMAREAKDRFPSAGDLRIVLERYLAEKVSMNYSGRLLVYLFHKNIINVDEAETFVTRDLLENKEIHRRDENLPPRVSSKTIAYVQGALGFSIVLWILAVQLFLGSSFFGVQGSSASALPGSLKVVAWPWAEIFIDDAYKETTPVARSFSLPAGLYEITLKNPYYQTVRKKVFIEPGRQERLHVTLTRKTEKDL